MTRVNTASFSENHMAYLDDAILRNQVIQVSTGSGSAVLLSAERFHELEKAARNAAYLQRLDESYEQLREGKEIRKTMEELKAMEQADA